LGRSAENLSADLAKGTLGEFEIRQSTDLPGQVKMEREIARFPTIALMMQPGASTKTQSPVCRRRGPIITLGGTWKAHY
jgi:hypothetical protein